MAEDVLRTAEISEQDSGFALGLMGTCVLVRACRSLRSELPGECGSRAAKPRVIIARGGARARDQRRRHRAAAGCATRELDTKKTAFNATDCVLFATGCP